MVNKETLIIFIVTRPITRHYSRNVDTVSHLMFRPLLNLASKVSSANWQG